MSKISFEDFCKKHKIKPELPIINGVSDEVRNQLLATWRWELIVKTLNSEGQEKEWMPDYSNRDEPKYELWLQYSPSSGWSLNAVDLWHTITSCGARRVFRTREIGRYAGTELLHFYTDTF
jgi:hypothetical protein